jgi:hypothetical protein
MEYGVVTTDGELGRLWPEPWASHASMQAAAIQGELNHALAKRDLTQVEMSVKSTVEDMLKTARAATERSRIRWRGPTDRWRGTSVERSHYYLHAAKIAIVDVLDAREVDARIPGAVARVATCLTPTDMRRPSIDALLDFDQIGLPEKRAGLKRALEIGYDASDQLHARVRGFRNLLITVGVTILIFMAVMVAVVSASPESVPLCFTPSVTASQAGTANPDDTASTRTVCPGGQDEPNGPYTHEPEPQDIGIVAGLGLVGGALAGALAIRNLRGSSIPYDVPLALAFLKVPIGALTAVAGILLLGGGFVPGLSELDSQRQILAYALLLGYAQQVGTQLIDKQAQSLLNAVPSKDPDGKQPDPPPPTTGSGRAAPDQSSKNTPQAGADGRKSAGDGPPEISTSTPTVGRITPETKNPRRAWRRWARTRTSRGS